MKTQLLTVVLLILAIATTEAFAQNRDSVPNPASHEHPLFKKFKFLDKIPVNRSALKTQSDLFQLDQIVREIKISEDDWFPYRKIDHVYQDGNRVETRYSFSDTGDDWMVEDKELYSYENGRVATITSQSMYDDDLINEYRLLLTYQQSGGSTYIQRVIEQYWNSSEEEWGDEHRITINVEAGRITEALFEDWDGDEWGIVERALYEESGGDLVELLQYYDGFSSTFENEERIVYSNITASELYDLLLLLTDYIDDDSGVFFIERYPDYVLYDWIDDGNGGEWVPAERQITTSSSEFYNGATSAIKISYEYYDFDDEWLNDGQNLIGYDSGRVVSAAFFAEDFFSENPEFIMLSRDDFMYDSNDLLEQILAYRNDSSSFFKSDDEMQLYGRSTLTWSGAATTTEPGSTAPLVFRLNAAYPNPFNPSTVVPYQLAAPSNVTIRVYDMLGRNVATLVDEFKAEGSHTVRFDASGLSSGVYLIRLDASGTQQTRSVTLLK